jgi:hypothetical protein
MGVARTREIGHTVSEFMASPIDGGRANERLVGINSGGFLARGDIHGEGNPGWFRSAATSLESRPSVFADEHDHLARIGPCHAREASLVMTKCHGS